MIKQTIIFDLSEVLIAGLHGTEIPLSEVLTVESSTILPAFFGCRLLEDLCCAKVTEIDFLKRVIFKHGWDISAEQMKKIVRRNFRQHVPGMQSVLSRLNNSYELVLLSDHVAEWVAYIKAIHPFLEKFDSLFFSCDMGQTKQEASTFEMVLDSIGQTSQECLFIDDNKQNVMVAQSVGIEGIHFANSNQLVRQLRQRGFKI